MTHSRVAYVAGKYRAADINGIHDNIEMARMVGVALWSKGWAPIVPHLNSAYMDGVVPPEAFLSGDLSIIRRLLPAVDIMVMLPDWQASEGARGEYELAIERGLVVRYWPDVEDA